MATRSGRPESLAATIAVAVRSARTRSGWSQRELARRLRVSHGAVQRLEGGTRNHLNLAVADAAVRLLGIRLTVDADLPGFPDRADQRDAVHAWCCDSVVRRLRAHGWQVWTEVEVGRERYRGWIDVLAYRREDRALLVVEMKTVIVDLGRTIRSLSWYARSAGDAARRLGCAPRSVVPALFVLATVESDARLMVAPDLIRSALPGRAAGLTAWIEGSAGGLPPPTLAMFDPSSHRRSWLIATRSDGRRSPAPYVDYRDAATRRVGHASTADVTAGRRPRGPPRDPRPSCRSRSR
jgi:transcriptional regulator with XRE-family HTH domain